MGSSTCCLGHHLPNALSIATLPGGSTQLSDGVALLKGLAIVSTEHDYDNLRVVRGNLCGKLSNPVVIGKIRKASIPNRFCEKLHLLGMNKCIGQAET